MGGAGHSTGPRRDAGAFSCAGRHAAMPARRASIEARGVQAQKSLRSAPAPTTQAFSGKAIIPRRGAAAARRCSRNAEAPPGTAGRTLGGRGVGKAPGSLIQRPQGLAHPIVRPPGALAGCARGRSPASGTMGSKKPRGSPPPGLFRVLGGGCGGPQVPAFAPADGPAIRCGDGGGTSARSRGKLRTFYGRSYGRCCGRAAAEASP